MDSEILINVTRDEIRVGLLEGGQVVEFYVERKLDVSLVGNIYKGKVVKILPGMQSAFVDIGLEKAAFLYVTDIHAGMEEYAPFLEEEEKNNSIELISKRGRPDLTIEELIQEGQEILVQVSKDPIGSKGARVTSYVTIPGRYLVLMPNVEHIGISRRISDEAERIRLRTIVEYIKPKSYGLIIRTASEGSTEADLKKDLEFLLILWETIQRKKDKVSAPSLLYSDLDLAFRSVRDLMIQDVKRLVIDSDEEYERIKDFVRTYFEKLLGKIELYEGIEPIFDAFGIELDISRALGRKVWLKSGGYIIIDQTEAMMVIDVNTGKFVGKEELEDTILKTNLEAVKEIVRQIRLRDLGGIIVIDFIDMDEPKNRERVSAELESELKRDRAKTKLLKISEFGLIELTRKRTKRSLDRMLSRSCPYCEGSGRVKSAETLSFEIMQQIKKSVDTFEGDSIVIRAHPEVAAYLEGALQTILDLEMKNRNLKIAVRSDSSMHYEQFDIMTI